MASKLCPKIILEGTRLTLKIEFALALNEHPRIVEPRTYRDPSPVISAESCAFTKIPWSRGLIDFLPDEDGLALETYRTWLFLFELPRSCSWIIDRFHLSTRAYQLQVHGRGHDSRWLEDGLASLEFHPVLCGRRPEALETGRAERVQISWHPGQYDDLSVFIQEPEPFRRLAEMSMIPMGRRRLRQ